MLKKSKKIGFTLAETLITLGIIGVVAALVIPPLISQYEQTQNIVAWKKIYSTIDQAQRQIMNDNGGSLTNGFGLITSADRVASSNNFAVGFIPYLRVVKQCGADPSAIQQGCYSGTFKALTDDYTVTNYPATYNASVILNDGAFVLFYSGTTSGTFSNDSHLFIDVNGSKLPNRFGKDIFDMFYNSTKGIFVPNNYGSTNQKCDGDGWNCSSYYLINNN